MLPLLSSWIRYCLGRSLCPFSPLGFYFYYSFSCYAHGLASCQSYHVDPLGILPCHGFVGCHSCHVGPLGLLPLFLDFLDVFTLSLPLIVLMGLLTITSSTLAHWVYYLSSWASSIHLPCFYFLLCPLPCWLSFLPPWPIVFIIPLLRLPWPIYFIFISYCAYGPVNCHSCHIGPLGLLSYFYHLYSFFLSSSLLLGFFCHWTFCPKCVSTTLSI